MNEIPPQAHPVILDTDMSGDCDDCGALALLHKLEDFGEVKILACLANGRDIDGASGATIQAINTYYQRPNIPIAAYHGASCLPTQSSYTATIRDEFQPAHKPDGQLPSSVQLYRKALATADRHSVIIISIGFLINLRELLDSSPDQISPLSGKQLVEEKIKRLVLMGGYFPKSGNNGGEFNFAWGNAGPDTKCVIEKWPGDVYFSPFEAGDTIITGRVLASAPVENPVRRAYELYANSATNGRQSWDLLTVLGAVYPTCEYWNFQTGKECQVFSDGTNIWRDSDDSRHFLQCLTGPPAEISSFIDELLGSAPGSLLG